jgi:hypothetical protein
MWTPTLTHFAPPEGALSRLGSGPAPADTLRRALAAALALALAGTVAAAPSAVEAFDGATWTALQSSVAKPTAVVFTATYCAVCPAVVQAIERERRVRRIDATLIAVVIDAVPGERALLRDPHYRAVDRLYAFAAPAPQVQHAVNPRWRGTTPSVMLLAPGARPLWSTGAPSAAALQAWAGIH